MKRLLFVLLVLVLVIPLSGFTNTQVKHGNTQLAAVLTGGEEVPGPGDPDGFGSASVQVYPDRQRICYLVKVEMITLPASAAHIHLGASGVAGPVVVPLNAPDERGFSSSCVHVTAEVIDALLDNPSGYYVNVHNVDFPAGAVRGQLQAFPLDD